MLDMFKEMKQNDEEEDDSTDGEKMEPGTEGDEEPGSDAETVEGTNSDKYDNDELSNEEQNRLHKNIINVIKEFSTLNKME